MSYPKVCLYCDTPFEAKREAARYCSEQCKNDWHTENRAASVDTLPQRVERHVLDEVRGLLEEHKGDWTLIVREFAQRTLTSTGYLSAADFTILGVPAEHCNLPGAQIGAFAGAGYMEAISFKRWSAEAKASRKSGKYWVYRITQKGKETLVGGGDGSPRVGTSAVTASSQEQSESVGLSATAQLDSSLGGPAGSGRSTEPGDPGPIPAGVAGVGTHPSSDTKCDEVSSPPLTADAGPSPDSSPEQLFKTLPSAYDPMEGWAA